MTATLTSPFHYFGGKRKAAPLVWEALGDVGSYIEPFAGSAAVLLARPHTTQRRHELLNEADGMIVNLWRSIKHSPAETAKHASGPVIESDYHARRAWLQQRRTPDLISWLEGDPEHHDPKMAGYWLYVASSAIGTVLPEGPWHIQDGHLIDTRKTPLKQPATTPGTLREIPILARHQGINRNLGPATETQEEQVARLLTQLQHRLSRVQITNGDWKRVMTPSILENTLSIPGVGIFLDPPYEANSAVYSTVTGRDTTISKEVREWCKTAKPEYKIVLAGYDNEHDELIDHGWAKIHSLASGANGRSLHNNNKDRERLWLSPSCNTTHDSSRLF